MSDVVYGHRRTGTTWLQYQLNNLLFFMWFWKNITWNVLLYRNFSPTGSSYRLQVLSLCYSRLGGRALGQRLVIFHQNWYYHKSCRTVCYLINQNLYMSPYIDWIYISDYIDIAWPWTWVTNELLYFLHIYWHLSEHPGGYVQEIFINCIINFFPNLFTIRVCNKKSGWSPTV